MYPLLTVQKPEKTGRETKHEAANCKIQALKSGKYAKLTMAKTDLARHSDMPTMRGGPHLTSIFS